MTDTPVEIMARAIATLRGHRNLEHMVVCDDGSEQPVWQFYAAGEVTAALSALEREGLVVVPKEPTKQIVAAYIDADPRRRRFSATAKRDYRAMIAARPDQESGA